jgi:hypothetical protein
MSKLAAMMMMAGSMFEMSPYTNPMERTGDVPHSSGHKDAKTIKRRNKNKSARKARKKNRRK